MTKLFRALAALLVVFAALQAEAQRTPMVVAYLFPQDAKLTPDQVNGRALTRINYAFANIENGRMVTGFKYDAENFATLNALKKENPSLTVLVSVGGWLWSGGFTDAALTTESRTVFIDSVMDFLDRYQLDGLDIDWEFPGDPGAGHKFRAEDKQNFTLLLAELRKRFDDETKRSGKRLYLTFAAGSGPEFVANTEMARIARIVDTVNLMAYDFYEPGSAPNTGHHAPLYNNPADPHRASSDISVRVLEDAGVPAEKILLGLPFYGHVWGEVPATAHGLFQPGKQIPNAFAPYSMIVSTMLGHGFTRYWDDVSKVPYLYNADKKIFVSYEDPESIAVKGKYVLKHKLGGVMFWSYEADSNGALLGAVDAALGLKVTQ
ncbi:glycoside hydrolase family 18 protein [Terracidiphilus gabretensis]|uniref:glycoside hydrolase family 18 protein n=1 Tax=Terracidiphilus gabretensis TaxID=1577687 RepID=UPI00071B859C|nr:glycoside hydrolase family 18 protein [Terracidiphilus gabretensis]